MGRKRSKWCYAAGCSGRDLCYTMVSLFLLTYIQYTNLVNTAQFLVLTVIIFLLRIWDAVNDPIMSTFISNTKSKFGKYRPWVLIGAITNGIIMICMFTVRVEVGNNIDTLGWYNVAIISVLYFLYDVTFTANDVGFWSILPTLAKEKKERDSLTTMVAVFASVGAFAAGGLIPILTPGDMIRAYRNCAIIFTIIFLICQLMVFFLVHDNEDDTFIEKNATVVEEENVSLKHMFKILFRNKQLLVIAVVVLLHSLAGAILNAFGQNFFWFKYGYNGNQMFIFTVIYAIGTIVSQALFAPLASKFSRNQLVKISTIGIIAGYLGFFAVMNLPIDETIAFVIATFFGILLFLGQGLLYMVMLIMLTNTIEYDEWQTGQRNDAVTFSVRPFMVKLAGAIQYLIVAVTLVVCGLYSITSEIGKIETSIASNEINKEAGTAIIEGLLSQASTGQMLGLSAAMTLVPVLLFIVEYFIIKKKYIITEEFYDQMISEIAMRKEDNNA